MRKIVVLFVVLSSFLWSCSGDSENGSNQDIDDLVGTWVAQNIETTGTATFEVLDQNITAPITGEGYDVDFSLTFSENPNNYTTEGSFGLEISITYLFQTMSERIDDQEFLGSGTWSKDGNVLTIVENGETTVLTISELTNTSLVLTAQETETITEDGITYESEFDLEVSFIKQ
ncbi:lipocalin family protein [Tamlana sp. 62-3]|uniref:Lipocalin family protein n=1 Tax=Neotamlana sargassicola TaxID=2883125 RepID=A0A9X1I832_9FLAO|nr:lipocalin family protein [Tamlana sargassicola]MCB4808992.1 lipocalin family protein [Tamlana sargassicola]